jgi:hypothetical protein
MIRLIRKGDLLWGTEDYLEIRRPWLYRALTDQHAGTVRVELVSPEDGPTLPVQGPYESWWFKLAAPAEFADAFLKSAWLWEPLQELFQEMHESIEQLEQELDKGRRPQNV